MSEDRLDDIYDLIIYSNTEIETYHKEYRVEELLTMKKCLDIIKNKYNKKEVTR